MTHSQCLPGSARAINYYRERRLLLLSLKLRENKIYHERRKYVNKYSSFDDACGVGDTTKGIENVFSARLQLKVYFTGGRNINMFMLCACVVKFIAIIIGIIRLGNIFKKPIDNCLVFEILTVHLFETNIVLRQTRRSSGCLGRTYPEQHILAYEIRVRS